MSTKQIRHPGRRLLVLLVLIALGFGVLATGVATGRTTVTPGLALDLEGGTQIILTPTTTDGSEISDEDIAGVNIPTGIPLVYELDEETLKPIKKGGTYLDPEAEAKIAAVANQGK